ncbi:hypothetical protein DL96DRAFT_1631117 [Flagelloscypha sp. PMI_526]|nr:hypothetical protein DL96DRAFT_1631117 [Flagelloscypha sp. PMI_526]
MHSALDIAEIRQSVSGFCDDPSLAALSLTASLWTPFALDALYGQPIPISCAFYPLIFLDAFLEADDDYELVFPKSTPKLSSTAIDRFTSLYASRVRGIIYSPPGHHYTNKEAKWIAALENRLPPVWFPKLSLVDIQGKENALDDPCSSTILVVTHLLAPTVQHFHLSQESSSLAWMPDLQSSLPLLTTLTFDISTPEANDAWSRIIPSLASLDTIGMQEIRFDEIVNLENSAFSTLQKLPNLKSLFITTSNVTDNYIPELFNILGSLHTLIELSIHQMCGTLESGLSLEDVKPLLRLRRLEKVYFHLSVDVNLKDADIEVMLVAWPRLTSFQFTGLKSTTVNVLPFLAHHPSLREVEMYMDLSVELLSVAPLISSKAASSPRLTSLTMVQPNFDGLSYETLALFISAIVPGVRRVFSTISSFFANNTAILEANAREFNKVLATISDNGH